MEQKRMDVLTLRRWASGGSSRHVSSWMGRLARLASRVGAMPVFAALSLDRGLCGHTPIHSPRLAHRTYFNHSAQ
ncbi:hypothetical protein HYQ46_011571 [Verticillium longisporum]|nr:hypothetical protein HYQ46_011571 [Verticillium longisporum]